VLSSEKTAVAADVTAEVEVRVPRRLPVAGVLVSCTTYGEAVDSLIRAAHAGIPLHAAATSVHGLTIAAIDPGFGAVLNSFELVTPDGQPVRWAMNALHGAGLRERVYGPTLMRRLCEAAEAEGVSVYFYGARPDVLARLVQRLGTALPRLSIAGHSSPPFRPLTSEEDAEEIDRIITSQAQLVFVGLGCPRQERWAYVHRAQLRRPVVCVGAAFDFHAGTLRQAPSWMQSRGLEWLFRLLMEPRRLWRRYAKHIPIFVMLVTRQYLTQRLSSFKP
jgi:N-acetylglucosaminyldiphosphoundecaprenol N-acetyl-beta-D-mannosaminyltransferase